MNKEELHFLSQNWTHSFEEDHDGETVYRPAAHSFPRSRGRTHLNLKENGEVRSLDIGYNDVPEEIKGSWTVEGNHISIHYPDGKREVYELKEIKPDKLVLRFNR